MYRFFCILIAAFLLAGCAKPQPPKMYFKSIDLSQQRVDLTRDYRCKHYELCDPEISIVPRMIVIHSTRTNTWQEAYQQYKQPALNPEDKRNHYGRLNVSIQFLVARDGTVYQLMPSDWMARHVVGLNDVAIGIANVGGLVNQRHVTAAQMTSDVFLIRMLKQQYPDIDYLVGHSEVSCFRSSYLWNEHDATEVDNTEDPGQSFMRSLRQHVTDLDLKSCEQH